MANQVKKTKKNKSKKSQKDKNSKKSKLTKSSLKRASGKCKALRDAIGKAKSKHERGVRLHKYMMCRRGH